MSPRRRILVAEDDLGVRELILARLAVAGYDTHSARNGRDAMDRAHTLKPDGIVLDINMPVMDGFEVLEALRAEWLLKKIPVLVLTARHAEDDVRRAVSLGAKDFLTKPFNDGQLIARVARLVRAPISGLRGEGGDSRLLASAEDG
jgi:DNA-binding response OmpR family regulator